MYQKNFDFSFKLIRSREVPAVVKGMLDIVEKHDPVALKIEGMYLLLKEKRPLMSYFTDKTKSDYSGLLETLRQQRNGIISAITLQMKACSKSSAESMKSSWEVTNPLVNKYLYNILTDNDIVITEKVENFLRNYYDNTVLVGTATTLGIHVYVDELRDVMNSIAEAQQARSTHKASLRFADKQTIRYDVMNVCSNLLLAIDLAEVEHKTIDYGMLKAELSGFLAQFSSLVKSRATRSKNSETVIKETTVESSTTTTSTAI